MTLRPFAWVLAALAVAGCAEITPPTPSEVLESPFGKGPLRVGMKKDEVRELWGEPATIESGEPDRWGATRDTWIYEARFPQAPVNAGYVSKTQTLVFDGDNLVSFHD